MDILDQEKPKISYFAATNYRNEKRKFGIKEDDRRRHMYLIGKTGMGKSTMMENMIIQDIRAGFGVGVVDPHGELVEKVLQYIPSSRLNDVVYINPADMEFPVAFNILENVDPNYKHLVASGLMGVFTKIWQNMWSARMEYILNNCILALLDSPGNTLLGINRLLVDPTYRKKIVSKITDPVVKSFWVDEYANYNERFRTEAIAPIQNKVGQFLSSTIIRNIVGQPKSTINMREIMDGRKILLLNLAKGRIGEDNSRLLGAMMIVRLQLAAMSRIDVPESQRPDFYLYVDEFQNFASSSFADILSEARKFRLCLVLAHQYIEQLDEKVAASIFGNVGTLIVFRVGSVDAEALVKEFDPFFTETDLVNLSKYDIYLRLMIDGVASRPFSATTLPPAPDAWKTDSLDKVIRVSRERYAKSKAEVEDKIIRWSGLEDMYKAKAREEDVVEEEVVYKEVAKTTVPVSRQSQKPQRPQQPASTPSPSVAPQEEQGTLAVCDNCGNSTRINFIPDAWRNIFCKNCFKLFKQGKIPNIASLPKRNLELADEINTPTQSKRMFSPAGTIPASINDQSTTKSISLSEALQSPPVSFRKKKTIVPPVAQNIPEISPPQKNLKPLEPDHVVKLNKPF